ncbi:MAG: DUF721 domain-containing protein [bacterium]|nr:DUF721 domain-containing protein [bacterium]
MGELLPQLLSEVGLEGTAQAVTVIRIWDEALGPEFSPHCRPAGVRSGVVHAHVRDSAWMQRLQLEKQTILRRLSEFMDDAPPSDLRLRIGPLEDR